MTDELLVERGRITTITINRPEKRNAMTPNMMEALTALLYELDKDRAVAVIVLKGAGKGFCSGADLGGMAANGNILEVQKQKNYIGDLLAACVKIRPIVISSVHGFALAGGFGLAMTTDITIVTDDCKLGMPEIRRGLVPMNIMNPLSRVIPRKRLLEYMATGDFISPQDAENWGLVNRLVPADKLEEETEALAQKIANSSGSALALMKKAFYTMQDMDYFDAYAYLTDMLVINSMTDDAKEGTTAFLEKRPPKWTDK